ncbi:MAG: glutamyl-tRNA reductase [Halobacteriales archaeon]|jgi:glutamyl-tRNA reductase
MDEIQGAFVTHAETPISTIADVASEPADTARSRLIERGATEVYVLQTCNRVEYYIRGDPELLDKEIDRWALDRDQVVRANGIEAARHAFRVAAGLESMVLGEDEILGQFSDALEDARRDLGGPLETLLEKALRTGKRVRSETRINEGHTSIASAAVDLADEQVSCLSASTAIVIGAGEMGQKVAAQLVDVGTDVIVANRSLESARRLAEDIDATPIGVNALDGHVSAASLLVSATDAPHPVVDGGVLSGTDLVAIDLATPADVDPDDAERAGIKRLDLRDVEAIVDSSRSLRSRAAENAEPIIDEELDQLKHLLRRRRADHMLAQIYQTADEIKAEEIEHAVQALDADVDEHEREVIEKCAESIVNRLLSTPTQSIKRAAVEGDYETLETVADVFQVPESEPNETDTSRPTSPQR